MRKSIFFIIMLLILLSSYTICQQSHDKGVELDKHLSKSTEFETATFGTGCFWCVEAVYQQLDGVISVTSGYSGGTTKKPTYEEVCTGKTGHAEVIQVVYDTTKISFKELLEVFWKTHDPTTLNRQGNDVGSQYRSVIFYHHEKQKKLAEEYKKKLDISGAFDNPIVTEILPFKDFFKAEDYHQNYYNQNSNQPYCRFVIQPKLEKFKMVFKNKTKNTGYNELTPEEERVIIHKGTEQPFTGKYVSSKDQGTYICRRCNTPLYRSYDKFDSECGWPSFDDEIPGAVKRIPDDDGMRTEIICAKCGAHLGHVFLGEGFTQKDTRHCVNSVSLDFNPTIKR